MTNSLPPRSISIANQLATLLSCELRRLVFARKTIVLLVVQLLPAIAALVYVLFKDIDGLTMFRSTVEMVTLPFLLPLAALFYGGPTIVDEMEGRTLTYLTLRPVAKPVLFLGKFFAGTLTALVVVLVPLALLFLACLGKSSDLSASLSSFGFIMLAAAMGVITYSAIFALLGVVFATSLLSGIIYFVVVEMVFSLLPLLELLSVRYYLRTTAGFNATDRLGLLDRLILEEPLKFEWWVGVLVAAILAVVAVVLGAFAFRERQYHV
ncbi:MAG: ABC transporter permease [Bradymonadaceae bacterium]|nr:ABC transporter permease [Lujinxingiaceae bacterium]